MAVALGHDPGGVSPRGAGAGREAAGDGAQATGEATEQLEDAQGEGDLGPVDGGGWLGYRDGGLGEMRVGDGWGWLGMVGSMNIIAVSGWEGLEGWVMGIEQNWERILRS